MRTLASPTKSKATVSSSLLSPFCILAVCVLAVPETKNVNVTERRMHMEWSKIFQLKFLYIKKTKKQKTKNGTMGYIMSHSIITCHKRWIPTKLRSDSVINNFLTSLIFLFCILSDNLKKMCSLNPQMNNTEGVFARFISSK